MEKLQDFEIEISRKGILRLLGFKRGKTRISPKIEKLFEEAYGAASQILPNNNILNIISKAKQEPASQIVLDMFRTDEKIQNLSA